MTVAGGPQIQPVSSKPFGKPFPLGYLDPFQTAPLPPGLPALPPAIAQQLVHNPNVLLQNAIAGQTITNTVVLTVSTKNAGGIFNIPFLVKNADAVQMDAIFWIETVSQPNAPSFLQLQYTQTVILNFLGISWPHISVATLVKQ